MSKIKAGIKKKIDRIDTRLLPELEKYIDSLIETSNPKWMPSSEDDRIYKYLDRAKIQKSDESALQELLIYKWSDIKRNNSLTKAFIRYFENLRYANDRTIINRLSQGSGQGSFFEDRFFLFLKCFLKAQKKFYHRNQHFLHMELGRSVAVKNFKNKQQPDILIHNTRIKAPVHVIELKKKYTHHSVKRDYNEQVEKWKGLNPKAKFSFIIFESSSAQKARTYQNAGCHVVCHGIKTKDDDIKKGIPPTIVTPIEDIFEEISNKVMSY